MAYHGYSSLGFLLDLETTCSDTSFSALSCEITSSRPGAVLLHFQHCHARSHLAGQVETRVADPGVTVVLYMKISSDLDRKRKLKLQFSLLLQQENLLTIYCFT